MTIGQSVVIEHGKVKFSYNGKQAVLLFEWDEVTGIVISKKFEVMLLPTLASSCTLILAISYSISFKIIMIIINNMTDLGLVMFNNCI